jgi:polyferredoxin
LHRWLPPLVTLLVALFSGIASAEMRFPTPEFKGDYKMPPMYVPPVPAKAWPYIDTALLAIAMGLGAYFVYWRRSRRATFVLMAAALAYFGFVRKGCVCPIGSIQNVAESAFTGSALPWVVAAFFGLPILFTFFFGRVFCGTTCPLGAIQDAVVWKTVPVPAWLERVLGLFPFIYLGLAVMLAAIGSQYIICRYDPFVGLFRLSGPANMMMLGLVFLVVGMFIGRPYCRFLCPLGAIFRLISPLSWKRVSITPKDCVDCRMCEDGCPFGAIRHPTAGHKIKDRQRERQVLVASIVAVPALMLAFAVLGYFTSTAMAKLDWRVRLSQALSIEERTGERGTSDETANFWKSGEPAQKAHDQAVLLQRKFRIGTSAFGAWSGLVIGVGLVGATVRKHRVGWTADAGTCVACARCYNTCPVEHARRTGRSVEEILGEQEKKKSPEPVSV